MFSISNLNGYSMLVVDENAGEIIFPAAENAASLSSQDRTALFRALEQGAPQFSVSLHGKNCLAVTQEASLTGWTVVGFVPYENILSDFLETRTQVLLIALACGMFILLCILLSTSLVTRNLNRLSQAVAKIDQEHLSLDVEIQSLDEVGQLYRQIQFMLRSIWELIADIRGGKGHAARAAAILRAEEHAAGAQGAAAGSSGGPDPAFVRRARGWEKRGHTAV